MSDLKKILLLLCESIDEIRVASCFVGGDARIWDLLQKAFIEIEKLESPQDASQDLNSNDKEAL
jgi:hypothetical protein